MEEHIIMLYGQVDDTVKDTPVYSHSSNMKTERLHAWGCRECCHAHSGVTRDDLQKAIAIYDGMISVMDEGIGRTLDALHTGGGGPMVYLVVFTSAHRHFLGQHGLVTKGPVHYEDVAGVPFIAS